MKATEQYFFCDTDFFSTLYKVVLTFECESEK